MRRKVCRRRIRKGKAGKKGETENKSRMRRKVS
jgi:hypothetical protein